ncbi:MAG: FAD-binding oxidoreductase [Terracidiphilus sp.]
MPGKPPTAPQFQSWGHYPLLEGDLLPLYWRSDFPAALPKSKPSLPVGLGRSYGDVCLLDHGTLLNTRGMLRMLDFDRQTGLLRCEAGASLAEILDFAVPRGWFLPVTPGTKYVTMGGAVANDVHGKNHHVAGTFGRHVPRFELARSDGTRFLCSAVENPEWYRATIGGLGLTGLITWTELQLRPIVSRKIEYKGIKFHGIDEFLAISRASDHGEYTVAWIDCVAQGSNFARGIFMLGDHSSIAGDLRTSKDPRLSVPIDFPAIALNRITVGAFNALYYYKHLGREKTVLLDYEHFFYPLDSVLHWNRIYGHDGLLQFQCVLREDDERGIVEILRAIASSGLASFLAVIKVFGGLQSPGMLSFPRPGITLALDFPVRRQVSFALVDRLAEITLEHGGRMYPAKDARMTPREFQTFYPQWREFASFIDPAFNSAFWQRVTANA